MGDAIVSSFANSRAGAAGTLLFSRSDAHRSVRSVASLLAASSAGSNSCGTAVQDIAAAAAVYSRAVERGEHTSLSFNA